MKKFNQNEGYDSDDEELKLWENMPTKGNELRACTPTTAVALSKQTPVVAEPLPDKHATSLIEHFIYGVDATTYCVGALAHAMLRLTAIVLSCLVSVIKTATPVVTSVVWCVLCFMARMCFRIIRAPRFHDLIAYLVYVVTFVAAIMGCYKLCYEVARRNGNHLPHSNTYKPGHEVAHRNENHLPHSNTYKPGHEVAHRNENHQSYSLMYDRALYQNTKKKHIC